MKSNKYAQFVTTSFIPLAIIFFTMFPMGCTQSQQQTIEGLLKNVDIVDGKITIVTKDGLTHTITINSDTQIQVDEQSASIEALEPGAEVEIEVEEDGTAQKVNKRVAKAEDILARVEGTIASFQGDTLTIDTENGQIVVEVSNSTRIENKDDVAGTINDIKVGSKAEAYFNPDTRVASRIEIESEEHDERSFEAEDEEVSRGEAEGTIAALQGDTLTIRTESGSVAVEIANSTTIERKDGSLGNINNLETGTKVKAYFNPDTSVASRIEIESEEHDERSFEAEDEGVSRGEAEGTIAALQGDTLTIRTESGSVAVEIANSTTIERKDGSLGNISNLETGTKVKAYFDPVTKIASRIIIERGD